MKRAIGDERVVRAQERADDPADDRLPGALRAAEHERRPELVRRLLDERREPADDPEEELLAAAAHVVVEVREEPRAAFAGRIRRRLDGEAAPEVVVRARRECATDRTRARRTGAALGLDPDLRRLDFARGLVVAAGAEPDDVGLRPLVEARQREQANLFAPIGAGALAQHDGAIAEEDEPVMIIQSLDDVEARLARERWGAFLLLAGGHGCRHATLRAPIAGSLFTSATSVCGSKYASSSAVSCFARFASCS
jgi:hypothetical protein